MRPARLLAPNEPLVAPLQGAPARRQVSRETWIVLSLGLGASAVWSALAIVNKLTRHEALNKQTTALNTSTTPDRPWLDLAYQLWNVALLLFPVLLALYLLAHVRPPAPGTRPAAYLGLDGRRPARDLAWGLGLAAAIGIPGLGLYLAARAAGLNTRIAAANLAEHWWTVPVLLLLSLGNALLEETTMVGYLYTRWSQAGWSMPRIAVVSAVIRGCYHLYQGFGGFVGNLLMGLVLGDVYRRQRRVMPLVIAHFVIDALAYVGYSWLRTRVAWL